jgi:uncharacterized damage-inducible protein DinB
MSPEHARLMAAYNKWMNEKLYKVCADLPADELKRDRGAFFKSIHGTLNHIMVGDKAWFGRFTGNPAKLTGLTQILHENFAELRAARVSLDDSICAWTDALTAETLNSRLRYVGVTSPPSQRSCDYWIAVTHFFNHQTHHRGQITTLLSQCGLDVGATDLAAMPGLIAIDA